MTEESALDLRFVAAPAVIEDLRAELTRHTEEIAIVGSGPVTDATDLSFDLGQVAELMTALKDILPAAGALITVLSSVFKRRPKTEKTVIRLESPLGIVTLEAHRTMSEDEIRAAVRKLTEI